MSEIALTSMVELGKIRFDDEETQFVLDWIIANGKEDVLAEYLTSDDRCTVEDYTDQYDESHPLWTVQSLERELRGFDPDSGDPMLGNYELLNYNKELFEELGVPEPTECQRVKRIMPSGYRRGGGTTMRSPSMSPLESDFVERTVMYHLGKGVISIDIQSADKLDAGK